MCKRFDPQLAVALGVVKTLRVELSGRKLDHWEDVCQVNVGTQIPDPSPSLVPRHCVVSSFAPCTFFAMMPSQSKEAKEP